ncbi:MAG: L,D-transpeptidase family protein [Flavobacteriaceae bacterium]|nr:L,D-transpeptidase family protein [Flavobacteriaceae bacterium]
MIFILLISCKKEKPAEIIQPPKIEITEAGKIIPIDAVAIAAINDSCVINFYKTNHNKTFWLADANRKKLLALFNSIEDEGLFKEDFDFKKIQISEKSIHQSSDYDLVLYDLLLTENLHRFIQQAAKGNLYPKQLYTDWELKENDIDLTELLLNFQKKDSFDFALKTVRPQHIVYHQLQEALKIIHTLPKEEYQKIELKNKLVLNDTNEVLIEIKKKLIFWKDLKPVDSLTNIYDTITELAVKKFQMRHGLAPDGVIGIGTIHALNFTKAQREAQIIANMERWRWYPRNFEKEYLIVNIPDYTLHVIKNMDTTRTHKVIVGRAERKTPVLSSKLSHLIFNPTWTVPPTILKKDVVPAAIRDRNYLKNKKITMFDTQNKEVSFDNWNPKQAGSYRYVQSPGTHNSLGLVKFMFPNRFSIYLHDTNSRGFFDQEIRALSSGCIRLQNPFELTEYLLDNPEKWNLEKIEAAIKTGKTIKVPIENPIFIHIFYWTAWSENGRLQFRDDLYNLDAELYQKLKNKTSL